MMDLHEWLNSGTQPEPTREQRALDEMRESFVEAPPYVLQGLGRTVRDQDKADIIIIIIIIRGGGGGDLYKWYCLLPGTGWFKVIAAN